MKKLIWAIITIILLAFALYTGFNSSSIFEYILYCIFVAIIPLILIYKAEKTWNNKEQSLEDRNNKLVILFSIAIIIFFFILMGFAKPTCMPSAASFHPEFYTNTLDNTCKLDLYICGNAPPWYYSRDCNISFNEKIKMIINSRHYDVLEIESELYPEFYTDPYKNKCKLELLTYGNPPAYYSKDCNVSFNEKINIIKNSKYYAIFALKCLEGGFTGAYENNYQLDKNKHIVQGINCNDIFNSN